MSKFIDNKINYLKQNINKVIIFFAIYIVGIVLGLFFLGDTSSQSILHANANNYYIIIFGSNVSVLSAFFKCFFAGFLLSLITIVLGLNVYTIPFISIILFYRGVILGTAFVIFYTISGISGIIIFIILTLPIHFIITLGIIVASVLNYRSCCNCNFKQRLLLCVKNALVSILFTFIASLYLALIIIIIIKPINLLF